MTNTAQKRKRHPVNSYSFSVTLRLRKLLAVHALCLQVFKNNTGVNLFFDSISMQMLIFGIIL